MIRLLFDHHVRDAVYHGLLRRQSGFNVVRTRDVGLGKTPDDEILEWAFQNDRIVVSYDYQTMIMAAEVRLAAGLPIAGLFMVLSTRATKSVIDELVLIDACSDQFEWHDRIVHLPF